jgi:hypothetical protein
MSSPEMHQHETAPAASVPKLFLPVPRLLSSSARQFYIGGFLAGFALSGVIGAGLYLVL